MCKRNQLTDEQLSNSTTYSESKNVICNARVLLDKRKSAVKLAGILSNAHAHVSANTRLCNVRRDQKERASEKSLHEVESAHHLLARVGLESRIDVVLGGVCETVEEKVDTKQHQSVS